jgi:hypothetical protein
MPDYRCYAIGLSGAILEARDISCIDDAAAIAAAKDAFGQQDVEVWQRERRIYRGAPPSATTRVDPGIGVPAK